MDSFYPESADSDRLRKETVRIFADDDPSAVAEGQRIDAWKGSTYYRIRAINSSARTGDKIIYDTKPADADGETIVVPPAAK